MQQKRLHAGLLSLVLLAATSSPAFTQGMPPRGPDYFRDAESLARILGAAHAIRVLCNGTEDQYWRRYMADMLSYEAPEPGDLRSSLVRAFNDAFTRTSESYEVCSLSAVAAEAQFAREGQVLAGRLASHYLPDRDRHRGSKFE